MKNLKILFLNPFDVTGGSTVRLRRFYKFLLEFNYNVIYVESNTNLQDKKVININQKNNILGFILGTLNRLKVMLSTKYDILFTEKLTPFTLPTLILAKMFKKYIILDFDDWDSQLQSSLLFRYLFSLTENLSYNIPDFYICANYRLEKLLSLKTKKPKIVIPQGIDCELFEPSKFDKESIKKELGFKNENKIVGFLGCFTPGGIGEFEKILKGMEKVIKIDKNIYFLIIGGGRLLYEYKKKYNNQNFIFIGQVPHEKVPKYIAVCDVMTIWMKDDVGNRYKGTLKIIEYLLMEKPVVGFLVGETKESFGKYCFVTENRIDSFVETIKYVLKNSERIKIDSKEIREKYSFNNGKELLKEAIEKITNENITVKSAI